MMFGQNPEETQDIYNNAAAHPYDPQVGAGFFQGAGTGIAQGYEEGGAKLLLLGGDALAGAEKSFGFDNAAQNMTEWRKANLDTINSLNPDPHTVGFAGRMLYGLSETVPTAIGGFATGGPIGAAASIGAQQGYPDFRLNQQQGLDTTTAAEKAVLTGVTNAAGTLLPAGVGFGSTLLAKTLAKIGTGAAGNILFGAGDRLATSQLLKDRGYPDMAQQYKPLDAASVTADAITGAAFGGIAAAHEAILPSHVDAAMMAKNNQNLEVDSAPGVPLTATTRTSHVAAMKLATEQLLRGDEVDVSPAIKGDMNFSIDPASKLAEAHNDFISALRERGFTDQADELQNGLTQSTENYGRRADKIAEAQEKHNAATLESQQLQRNLEEVQNQQTRPLSQAEKITLVDPASGERMQSIEDELGDSGLNPARRAQLEAEYNLVAKGSDWKEIPAAMAERQKNLATQETDITAKLAARQKDTKRYAAEIERRTAKIKGEPVEKEIEVPPAQEANAKEPGKSHTDPAEEIAARNPDMPIATGEADDEGNPVMTTAGEAMAQDNTKPYDDAKRMIQAAVNCFLQRGV